jgi:hypothetical protein
MATRARVVLLRDKGVPIEVIARRLGCLKVASIEGLTRPPESSKAATVTARELKATAEPPTQPDESVCFQTRLVRGGEGRSPNGSWS